ncbi:MAG: UDP-N-acetylglucosamine--N-acetylmuramyl-(pentapeptide) pyrophosphoryl-undecaprenol N-acetylglucosamine transferase [Oscillospiraceae bacterium]|nr:UDP-N-acetylglucosamine--N-acetylmuramyl-(pentapeptide) pyrophosphoryl-undecaprenol N-acetylglucosamine transferase [Oscillospiraceae bacterium]
MNFMFVCSGTAGHINPAMAIAAQLLRKAGDSRILFVGSGREMEKRLVQDAGFELVNIKMSGLERGFSPKKIAANARTAARLLAAGKEAKRIIKSFAPDAVIGTGGYVCYPVLKAAARESIPTFVHESNCNPGLTVKLLSKVVDTVFMSFPGTEGLYKRPDRVVLTGTPVREEFRDLPPEPEDGGRSEKPLVVSFWGSLGARLMDEAMADFIKLNSEEALFRHIHSTGKGGLQILLDKLSNSADSRGLTAETDVREYIYDMPRVMAMADLVLCRAGGSTVAELASLRKPSILVPSPYVPDDIQTKNAARLCEAGAALMVAERDCTGKRLYGLVKELLEDRPRLDSMASSLYQWSAGNAEAQIVDFIFEALGSI